MNSLLAIIPLSFVKRRNRSKFIFNIQATHKKTSTGWNFKAFELWETTLTEIGLKKQWLELKSKDFHTKLFLASHTSGFVTSDTYITSFQQEHDSKSKRMNQHESPKTDVSARRLHIFIVLFSQEKWGENGKTPPDGRTLDQTLALLYLSK